MNITSCNKSFESSPKKSKEEHERGSNKPKDENCQPITLSSEHPLSLANNCQLVDPDGKKEVLTRKRIGVKKKQKTDFGELARKLQRLYKI